MDRDQWEAYLDRTQRWHMRMMFCAAIAGPVIVAILQWMFFDG